MTFFPLLLFFRGWSVAKTHCNWVFETSNTCGHALAKDLTELLDKYDLRKINHYLC